jgi:DMSO/TMAO reductase YedYZ heme-binding membrane subunit
MFWGVALSSRFLGKNPKPNWMLDLHRYVGGLSVVFTVVHVVALIGDSFIAFGAVDVLVPFATDYHPVAVAWGIIATYLLIAVEVTSLLRKRLSKRAWRTTHYLSFPLFGLSTVHLLWVGTDRTTPLLRFGTLLTVAIITAVTLIRLVQADQKESAATVRG